MEKFYINFYEDKYGQPVRGNWKDSEEKVEAEKTSHLYTVKLGLRWTKTAAIGVADVEEIARKNNCTVSDVLSSI